MVAAIYYDLFPYVFSEEAILLAGGSSQHFDSTS